MKKVNIKSIDLENKIITLTQDEDTYEKSKKKLRSEGAATMLYWINDFIISNTTNPEDITIEKFKARLSYMFDFSLISNYKIEAILKLSIKE